MDVSCTDKNREKIMIIRQFWQKYSHFEKIGENLLSFSSNFLMIFVSAGHDVFWQHLSLILINSSMFVLDFSAVLWQAKAFKCVWILCTCPNITM